MIKTNKLIFYLKISKISIKYPSPKANSRINNSRIIVRFQPFFGSRISPK